MGSPAGDHGRVPVNNSNNSKPNALNVGQQSDYRIPEQLLRSRRRQGQWRTHGACQIAIFGGEQLRHAKINSFLSHQT